MKGPYEVTRGGNGRSDDRTIMVRDPRNGKEKKVSVSNVHKVPREVLPAPETVRSTGSPRLPEVGTMIIYESCMGPDASVWGWILGKVTAVDTTEQRLTVWAWGTPYRNPKRVMKPAWFHPEKLNTNQYEKHSNRDLSAQGYQSWEDDTVGADRVWITNVEMSHGRVSARHLAEAARRVREFDRNEKK